MNVKYNCRYLKWLLILSAFSFMAAVYYYCFINGYINCSYVIGRFAAVLFYVSGAVSLIMLCIVNIKRTILERNLGALKNKKATVHREILSMGIFRFFSNHFAVSVDVLLVVLAADLITAYILKIGVAWYKDILRMMIAWFIYMHGILNGKNYIFFTELARIETKYNRYLS